MNLPTGDIVSVFFLLIPAVLLFVFAFALGRLWLLLVPLVGWPVLIGLGNAEGGVFNALLPVVFGCVGVALGLMFHRSRAESSR